MNEQMQNQMQKEKRFAEVVNKLSPEAQEKVLCFAEGLRLAEAAKEKSAS